MFFILFWNTFSLAQEKKEGISLAETLYSSSGSALRELPAQNGPKFYLVRLKEGVKRANKASCNFEIVRPLGDGYAIVRLNANDCGTPHAIFERVLSTNNMWKFSGNLLHHQGAGKATYLVGVPQEKQSAFAARLSSIPEIERIDHRQGLFTIHASHETILQKIIPLDEVLYVGSESREPREESRVLDLNLEPNTVNRIHHSHADFNGEGITISIKELAYDSLDIDLDGRHLSSSINATEISPHATEMATIAAGAGNSFVTGRGVAKETRLTSSDFANLFPDNDEDYASADAWVQNHSYGTQIENFYGSLAEAFDQSANQNPDLLHVFSSGNDGAQTSSSGFYQGITGFANLTGNFKMAKNVLVVGSADTVGRPVLFSSRGPAHDGRIKPELVAYSKAGSSNSAALVSGITVLLQQAYKELEGTLPASALLKALLVNSARDAGTEGIDFITGYGTVDSYRALQNVLSGHYFSGTVDHGQTTNLILSIPPDARNLKVTLAWNDPAAPLNADVALINDLDMTVTDDQSTTWLPWVLNPAANSSTLILPAIRSVDHLNNVEQITIDIPEPGDHTISISGFDVQQGPQQFYIAYQWDTVNQFEWSFPTGSDNMPYNGETAGYFRWQSTLSEAFGQLEYSIDNGMNWVVIEGNIDLEKGYHRWLPPFITTTALVRMIVGSQTFVTDPFTISRPQPISVGFDCADSVMLLWSPVPGASEYEVFMFNNSQMEPILISTDTAVILDKNEFPSKFYAVQPLLPNAARLIRSYTFDYELQGVACYIRSFFGEVVPSDGIYLNLQLGTSYGIENVFFERENEGSFEEIGSIQAGVNPIFQFLDDQPTQGRNVHRARIVHENGEEIITETVENYYITETPFLIFPNPSTRSQGLNVFSREFQNPEGLFRLYKTDGGLVLAKEITSDREFIELEGQNPGMYFYSIENREGLFNGKIVITE